MTFEFDGEKYRKASTHQKEWGNKIISEFRLRGDESILDLGCGDGALSAELAALVPQGFVLGIDASQGMIKTAIKHQRSNLEFKIMDINEIDFKSEFDLVFSNATLHWVKDHGKLLNNVYNSLRDNGIVRFNFAAEGNCLNFFKVIKQVMDKEEFAAYFKEFDWPWYMPNIDEYKALLEQFPFKEKRVWEENADRYFPDKKAMIKWIDQPSIVPILKYVDDNDKQEFRDTVVNQMIDATMQKDGTCFETFRRINVYAKKQVETKYNKEII
ncbi:MAG: methyltransferase domain-containing protein [Candidatus Bathyarchaeota archaeon]